MFDISFGELLLICLVALVVLGPERLPVVARTLGALVARAQRFVRSIRAEIGHQSEIGSLVSLKQEVQQTALAFKDRLTAEVDEARAILQESGTPVPASPEHAVDRLPDDTVTQTIPSLLPDVEPVDDRQPDLFHDSTPHGDTPSR